MELSRNRSEPEPTTGEARILVVEDDGVVAHDVEWCLEALGYGVAGVASSAAEALDLARDRRPDLVLMDIGLPGEMDGVDAADLIHRELDLPVVFLTARADPRTLRRVKRSMPYGYVVKPYDARSLESTIELALHLKRRESDLEWMAYHDPLTELVNRRGLEEQADRYLSLAVRQGSRLALLYLDLADFKRINDEHGHDAGDRVLAEVAERLRGEARGSDVVARVGGDEFVALLPDVESPGAAAAVARRYARCLGEPVTHEGRSIEVGGQIGIAVFPDHGTTFEQLSIAADRAMYRLKHGDGDFALADLSESFLSGEVRVGVEEGTSGPVVPLVGEP